MATVFLGKDVQVEIGGVVQEGVTQVSIDSPLSEIKLELYGDANIRTVAGQRDVRIEIQYAGVIPPEPTLNERKEIKITLTPTPSGGPTTVTFADMIYLGRRIGGAGANAAVPVTMTWAKSLASA